MNNTAIPSPFAELSSRHNSLADFRSSTYVREQSFRSHESFETGLVLQTKEGDQVTLSSNSFSQLDSLTYDSKGVVKTESEISVFSQSQREIRLASGQSFSFTVEGELNEDELEDIEAILKGLDGVMSEMSQGDTSGVLDKVMEMGNFNSVSSFAADITYQRSYEISSKEVATMTTQTAPVEEAVAEQKSLSTPASGSTDENYKSQGKKKGQLLDFDKFFKKMEKHLQAHGNKKLSHAQGPINNLFKHHLDDIQEDNDGKGSIYSVLESAMEDINSMIEEVAGNVFNDQLSAEQDEV